MLVKKIIASLQKKELELRIFKRCVRMFVDDKTYKIICATYGQKIAQARKENITKSSLSELFPNGKDNK